MSLIIAAAIVSGGTHGSDKAGQVGADRPTARSGTIDPAGAAAARAWVALVDGGRWDESWRAASTLFRSQTTTRQWAAMIEPVRKPLGTVSARAVARASAATSRPGAPAGEYQVVQFRTAFAVKPGAIETVVLAREDGAWKVAGYFIR